FFVADFGQYAHFQTVGDGGELTILLISESGINTYGQVRELSHFANGFLIGSALMSHDDLHAAVRRVL
ncbi:hypothetical protein NLN78_23315, partial [Citrobacter portucalensis]|uniref:hypothetical protein n=1 Tax=Citrobacter portucalensis TaxID=1639133 RepID=UPI00226ADB2A